MVMIAQGAVGAHAFAFEPPDILRIALVGRVEGPDVDGFLRLFHETATERGPFHLLVDATRLRATNAAARKEFVRVDRSYPFHSVLVHGARFTTQLVMEMICHAGRVIVPGYFRFPILFSADEAGVREQVAKLRASSRR